MVVVFRTAAGLGPTGTILFKSGGQHLLTVIQLLLFFVLFGADSSLGEGLLMRVLRVQSEFKVCSLRLLRIWHNLVLNEDLNGFHSFGLIVV